MERLLDNIYMLNDNIKEVIKHAHWIHFTQDDSSSVSGYVTLPQCICSNCRNRMNFEKKICPFCGSKMDELSTVDRKEHK